MSVRIRLTRTGKRKEPHYRVVVADQRSPRDGRFIEIIGKYHPLEEPSAIEIDEERALGWLRQGAQPSDSVATLLRKVGIWEKFETEKGRTIKTAHSKKGLTKRPPAPPTPKAKAETPAPPAEAKAPVETPAETPTETPAETPTETETTETS